MYLYVSIYYTTIISGLPGYVSDFTDSHTFGKLLWLESARRGSTEADTVVVIGDGAAWMWTLAEEHYPDAVQILDWLPRSAAAAALAGATYRGNNRAIIPYWRYTPGVLDRVTWNGPFIVPGCVPGQYNALYDTIYYDASITATSSNVNP